MGQAKPPRTSPRPRDRTLDVFIEPWGDHFVQVSATGCKYVDVYDVPNGVVHFAICDMCQGVSAGGRCDYCGRPLQ